MFDISMQGITLGPLQIRFYSLMILSGLLAGIALAQVEAKRRGHDPSHVVNIAVLGAVFGIIGARLYHVFDQQEWPYYRANPEQIVAVWNGGIGIFGAIAGAILALLLYTRIKRLNPVSWLDIGAPAFLLGQAIGRWGNFFNQELFGRPTSLPWGIPIDPANRPPQYADATHFHPLFLYESLLSFIGVIVLVLVARRFGHRLLRGDILLLYLIWYPAVRFVLEFFRIGNWYLNGVFPMAQVIGVLLVLTATSLLVWRHLRPHELPDAPVEPSGRRSKAAARRRQRRAASQTRG